MPTMPPIPFSALHCHPFYAFALFLPEIPLDILFPWQTPILQRTCALRWRNVLSHALPFYHLSALIILSHQHQN